MRFLSGLADVVDRRDQLAGGGPQRIDHAVPPGAFVSSPTLVARCAPPYPAYVGHGL
jgi:hypothetical protein